MEQTVLNLHKECPDFENKICLTDGDNLKVIANGHH